MATIKIPELVFPGFKIISELNDTQIQELVNYQNKIEIGQFYGDIAKDLGQLLNINGDFLWETIVSFISLATVTEDRAILAKNLAESYKEISRSGLNTKETNRLKENLIKILSNFDRVLVNATARDYKLENSNNLREFKFLTDIRFLVAEVDNEKKKYGIVLHKLYLEYQNSEPLMELHLHLRIEQLKELRDEIEKAILRDEDLRSTQVGEIQLV